MADTVDQPGQLLITCCAAPEGDHRPALQALSPKHWQELIALAYRTRTLPLLAHIAEGADLAKPVIAQLHEAAREAALHALAQGRAIARVIALLREAGLRPIALKGLALAYGAYPDPSLRPLRDVDLLLPHDEVVEAQKLLLSDASFSRLSGAGRYGIEYGHQLPEIVDCESGLVIELHHRLNARGWAGEPRLLSQINASATFAQLLGEDIRVPDVQTNFLHLVEHATWHHLFSNGPLLLADLHFLVTSHGPIDWASLQAEAAEMGLARALQLVAHMARHAGASWVPADLLTNEFPRSELLDSAYLALLDTEETARQHALLHRVTSRSGGTGPIHALSRAVQPDPYQLARLSDRDVNDPLKWLGYPGWLLEKGHRYLRSICDAEIRAASCRKSGLQQWIIGG